MNFRILFRALRPESNKTKDKFSNQSSGPYEILVDDNFRYMDESARYILGRYETLEKAIAVCKEIVDGCLDDYKKEGVDAAKLFDHYVDYGEDPFIIGGESVDGKPLFSAWTYAKQRCDEVCGA